ncbi:serpin family protein [Psychrobacter aestuarii]|nr:serpin family protein [Psychrobacter aestuarii]
MKTSDSIQQKPSLFTPKKLSLAVLVISGIVGLSACTTMPTTGQPNDDRDSAEERIATPEGIAQVVNANNQFAIDMYKEINSSNTTDNVFFSPYSLSTAVAMLYAGAQGDTQAQIQNTFHYPAPLILNANSAALYNRFNQANAAYDITTANDLWLDNTLKPKQRYIDTITRYYGGKVTNLDFANRPEPARQTINSTIAQHTQQMIPELLPSGSIKRDTASVLTNAIYFKGDWDEAFDMSRTADNFYNLDGTATQTKMMIKDKQFDYMENAQIQMVSLPYKGDDLSMLVVVPKSKNASAIRQLNANLSMDKINSWTAQLKSRYARVTMPKFKLSEDYQMKPLLSKMGMPIAFSSRADFSGFSDTVPLTVDAIVHKAVVEVDEKGTKAAAGTGVTIRPVSTEFASVPVKADHPFMFMIKDNKTNAILFLGQVNEI